MSTQNKFSKIYIQYTARWLLWAVACTQTTPKPDPTAWPLTQAISMGANQEGMILLQRTLRFWGCVGITSPWSYCWGQPQTHVSKYDTVTLIPIEIQGVEHQKGGLKTKGQDEQWGVKRSGSEKKEARVHWSVATKTRPPTASQTAPKVFLARRTLKWLNSKNWVLNAPSERRKTFP